MKAIAGGGAATLGPYRAMLLAPAINRSGHPASSRTVPATGGASTSALAVRYGAAKQPRVLEAAGADKADAALSAADHSSCHQGEFGEWGQETTVFDDFDSVVTLHAAGPKKTREESPTVSCREGMRAFSSTAPLRLGSAKRYPAAQNWPACRTRYGPCAAPWLTKRHRSCPPPPPTRRPVHQARQNRDEFPMPESGTANVLLPA